VCVCVCVASWMRTVMLQMANSKCQHHELLAVLHVLPLRWQISLTVYFSVPVWGRFSYSWTVDVSADVAMRSVEHVCWSDIGSSGRRRKQHSSYVVRHPRCVFINYNWINQLSNTTTWWFDICCLLHRYQLHVSALMAIFRLIDWQQYL